MKKNSMLSFLKEKSFLVVLTLMLVSAGTMAMMFAMGNGDQRSTNEIAQRKEFDEKNASAEKIDTKENVGEETADASGGRRISQIDFMEQSVPEQVLEPELEDQYAEAPISEEVAASDVVAEGFQEVQGLSMQWPVDGEIVMEFSMDHSVYFQTLAQYQYNPAMILRAVQGTAVLSGASGTVIDVGVSNEYGNYITVDLGEGFVVTYGQLGEITAEVGEFLEKGQRIGVIAAPSRSYSLEGDNLYLKLTKDGAPVNPELYLEKE